MQTLRALLVMARPLLLLVVIPIYILGSLIARAAGYPILIDEFTWGLAALLPVVLAAHYANEYADVATDVLTKRTPFSGGSGVLSDGGVPHALALKASWTLLGIGIIITLSGLLLDLLNPIAFILWVLGTFIGMAYSLPPFMFAWRGWSEVINAGLIALILPLYGYAIHTRRFDWEVLIGCLPFGLLIFILILSTNWADKDADAQVGKVTLANRLAPPQLRRVYAWAMIAGFVIQPLLTGSILPSLVVLSSIPAIPFMIWAAIRFTKIHSPHPTVLAMLVMMPLQLGAWYLSGP